MKKILVLFFLLVAYITASACHGVALVNPTFTNTGNSIIVNGNSDPATCGCGPYYMEVQVACFSPSNYAPNIPGCNANASWNVYPFYRSGLNIPNPMADNCVLEPYFPVTVPFTDLCPGTTYVLRARERVCGSGSAGPWTANYTFTTPGNPPTFILSAVAQPNTICPNTPVTITATISGVGGCGNGLPTFTLQPGNISNTTGIFNVTPSTTTTYTVSVNGGYLTCYPVPPVTVLVTVQPGPTVGVTSVSPLQVCSGGCVTLSLTSFTGGTLQWQSSPNGVIWTNVVGGTTNPYQYCPVTSSMFFRAQIIGAPGCGNITSNVVQVSVLPSTNVNLSTSASSVCLGQQITLTATGSNSYTWIVPNPPSSNVGSTTFTPTTSGTYSVISNSLCPDTASVSVVVNPLPTVQYISSPSICGGANGSITANPTGNGPYTYNWLPGNLTTQTISNINSGTYTCIVTDVNGCTLASQHTLTNTSVSFNTVDYALDVTCNGACDGGIVVSVLSGGTPPYTYAWSNGGNSQTISGLCVGTYSVIVTDSIGCTDTVTNIQVTQPNPLVTTISATPNPICYGQSSVLGTGTTGGTGPYTNVWSTQQQGDSIGVSPLTTTTYSVTTTDVNGCTTTAQVQVNVLPQLVIGNITGVNNLCQGSSTTLNINASGGNGGPYTYTWLPTNQTGTSINVIPNSTTTYTVIVSDGCSIDDTATYTVQVNPSPIVSFSTTELFGCEPLTVTFTNTTPNTAGCVWTIDGNVFTNCTETYTFSTSGTYSANLSVVDANGCTATGVNIQINVYPIPSASFIYSPTDPTIINNEVYFTNTSVNASSCEWLENGIPVSTICDPMLAFEDTGYFNMTLIVTSQYGCTDTTEQTIYVAPEILLFIPNAFSPNGDGLNEMFTPQFYGVYEYDFMVFDRWGLLLYQGSGGWDGTYQGNICQQDAYVWKLTYIHPVSKEKKKLIGHVSLIK